MSANINENLVKKRKSCTFDVQELIYIIDGGVENTMKRHQLDKRIQQKVLTHQGFDESVSLLREPAYQHIKPLPKSLVLNLESLNYARNIRDDFAFIAENYLLNVKELWDDLPEEYLSHKERYENAIRKAFVVLEVLRAVNKNLEFADNRSSTKIYTIQEGIFRNVNPLLVHIGLFWSTISSQASAEQRAEWLRPDSKMIGTYVQTEMGHGSFLRGMETTATFDPEADDFILNSPTLTSFKWWPGGLGKTANSSLVMAQLYINGKCYGLHIFLVQIRDYDTHEPFPGVKVGEIGPKMSFNTADNGYLGFDHYRIPRTNMLMKYAQVLRDGTYVKPKHEKLAYGSMVLTRVTLISDLAFQLAKAATIAVRYSAVRHQSHIRSNEPECAVLDLVSQQHKLFIAIASSHVFRVAGVWMWDMHTEALRGVEQGNMDLLPELHILACCLKAVVSRDATSLVEQCRLACGGHGFMMSSNLPQIYGYTAAAITYEGEYTVLLLQTARYLMKSWKNATEHKPLPGNIAFLADYTQGYYSHWQNTPEGILEGFKAVTAGKTKSAYNALHRYITNGVDVEEAWNLISVQLTKASEAYARFLLCDIFWTEIMRLSTTLSRNLATVLEQLAELYLVYWALEKYGDLLLYSCLSRDDIEILQERYNELLASLRPNAVGLVDSFDIRDEVLCSTLGAFDGRVYERMMAEAAKSPLNAENVNESFRKYMRPVIMKNKL